MFRVAVKQAMGFTLPIVTSVLTCGGRCSSGVGTCVVVNEDGWIVTAAHILMQVREISDAEARTRAKEQALANASRADRRSKKLGPRPDDIDKWSTWIAFDGFELDPSTILIVEPCDLAIGKLLNFDKSKIPNYPEFKDPAKGFESGTSLCRLRFPFYNVGTVFDPATGFRLVNTPFPIFPNEGILSRMHEINLVDPGGNPLPPPPFAFRMIETSSPGIKAADLFSIQKELFGASKVQPRLIHWTLGLKWKHTTM